MTISKRKWSQSAAVFLLILYAFTTGLIRYVYFGKQKVILLTFAVSITVIVKCAFYSVKISYVDILAVFMILVILFNNNQNIAREAYLQACFMTAILIFFIFARHLHDWFQPAMKMIMAFGIFYSLCTIIFMFTPDFYKNTVLPIFTDYGYTGLMSRLYDQGYMTGFTPHYSTNAMYLTVALGVPAAAIYNGDKRKRSYLIFGLVILALLLTGKRAHVIFGVCALMVCFFLLNCDKGSSRWLKIIISVIFGVLALLVASRFVPAVLNVFYRFMETAKGDVTQGRIAQWSYAIELFRDNKLFGVGWDAFRYEWLSMHGVEYNVHCVYIQLLCECGIVGSIPFYLFFLVEFFHTVHALKDQVLYNRQCNRKGKLVLTFSVYIETFFLLYCLTGNPLYDAQVLIPYILSCAAGEYYYRYNYRYVEVR